MHFDLLKRKLEHKSLSDMISINELISLISDVEVELALGESIKDQSKEIKELEEELFKTKENEQLNSN